ncbi:PQQ-binding-like beta-propeller repeat protein [Streptomyces sp. NPDC090106]|uniref:protein kinase domain-containing protein n=1 Tax=Streptomyces sp. NPDC090106 TaxID=3365946 RepID=UPI003820CCD4
MQALRATDPHRIGPYEVRGRLGSGGMGEVYLASSRAGLLLAVKVVRAEYAQDRTFRARFRQEVRAAQTVGGAGTYTARVVDADPEGEHPWMATEFVDGPNLRDAVLDGGAMPLPAVRVLGAALGEALAAIHAKGMVHRDLKPSNILLAPDGPRVIDFGIVRALEATAMTRTGAIVGSVGYVSPEQIRNGGKVGPPSDVFSLGAVLAYAASGREPLGEGQDSVILLRILTRDFDLSGVPQQLLALVESCLGDDPDARPAPAAIVEASGHTPRSLRQQLRPGWFTPTAPTPHTPPTGERWLPEAPRHPDSGDRESRVEYAAPMTATDTPAPGPETGSAPETPSAPQARSRRGPAEAPETAPAPGPPPEAAAGGPGAVPGVVPASRETFALGQGPASEASAARGPGSVSGAGSARGSADASEAAPASGLGSGPAAAAGGPGSASGAAAVRGSAEVSEVVAAPGPGSEAAAGGPGSTPRVASAPESVLALEDASGPESAPVPGAAPLPGAAFAPESASDREQAPVPRAAPASGVASSRGPAPAPEAASRRGSGPGAGAVAGPASAPAPTDAHAPAPAPSRRGLLKGVVGGGVVAAFGGVGAWWVTRGDGGGEARGGRAGGGATGTPEASATRAGVTWRYTADAPSPGDGPFGALSADGGTLYVAFADGTLRAVGRDGRERWTVTVAEGADAYLTRPLVTDAGILVGVGTDAVDAQGDPVAPGSLFAVSAGGEQVWTADLPSAYFRPPVALDGSVAVGCAVTGADGAGTVRVYGPGGAERGRVGLGGAPSGDLVAAGGVLYVPSVDNHLYAIDPAGPSVRWRTRLDGDVSRPAVGAGTVVVDTGNDAGELFGLDLATGERRWSKEGLAGAYVAADADAFAFLGVAGADASLRALTEDGDEVWRYGTGGRSFSDPVLVGSTVYVRTDTEVHAIGLDGEALWRTEVGDDAGAVLTPLVHGSRVYAATSHQIVALDTE